MENVIRMQGTGHKGRLPPVVERARVDDRPVTAGMVAELPGGGKDFGSDASDQKTEVGGQKPRSEDGNQISKAEAERERSTPKLASRYPRKRLRLTRWGINHKQRRLT